MCYGGNYEIFNVNYLCIKQYLKATNQSLGMKDNQNCNQINFFYIFEHLYIIKFRPDISENVD